MDPDRLPIPPFVIDPTPDVDKPDALVIKIMMQVFVGKILHEGTLLKRNTGWSAYRDASAVTIGQTLRRVFLPRSCVLAERRAFCLTVHSLVQIISLLESFSYFCHIGVRYLLETFRSTFTANLKLLEVTLTSACRYVRG